MSADFRARQIRVNQIINSGSRSTSPLLVYGLGSATNLTGGFNPLHFVTGTDTWMFISGSTGTRGTSNRGVVTFKGDVVTSGSLYVINGITGSLTKLSNGTNYLRAGSNVTLTTGSDGSVTIASTGGSGSPAGSNSSIQFNADGAFGAASSLTFLTSSNTLTLTGSSIVRGALQVSGAAGITGSLVIKDDTADVSQLILSSSAGSSIFNMYSDGNFYLTNNVASGQVIVGVTGPSSTGSQVIKIYPQNSGRNLTVFNENLLGSSAANPLASSDTNFFVNGVVGSRGSGVRGTSVFGGDVVSSGSHLVFGNITGSNARFTGDVAVNGGDITSTQSSATIFSTNVTSLGIANAASALSLGGSSSATSFTFNVAASRTGTTTLNLGIGATSAGNVKAINIGQGGDPGSTTNIRIGTTDTAGTSNIYMSGSVYVTGSVGMKGSIIPDTNNAYTLGTDAIRWAHVYTGDLHLRNERGDWTVIEENDFLRIVNNKTGKNYKMMMQLIED